MKPPIIPKAIHPKPTAYEPHRHPAAKAHQNPQASLRNYSSLTRQLQPSISGSVLICNFDFASNPMLERLQKIIARAGIASRRHAEELIRSGQVRVNGAVITQVGVKADPEHDKIEAAGKLARISEQRAYVLLHKPP